MKLYKISEKRYLKNPDKWIVWFIAWGDNGKPYAMAKKKK